MPFVKVPGFEREVWVDLHEPAPDTVPLVSDICTVVAMPTTSPDDWTVAPPTLTHSKFFSIYKTSKHLLDQARP